MSDHTYDRKGPPAKVIDESGDEPITRTYPTCSVCGVPQMFQSGPLSDYPMLWTLFTLVLGIVPATLLAFFAVTFVGAGVVNFLKLDGTWRLIVTALMFGSLCGLAGYAALWRAAKEPLTKRTALGLSLGLVGLASGVVMLLMEPEYLSSAFIFYFGGPALVAVAHLLRFAALQRVSARNTQIQ